MRQWTDAAEERCVELEAMAEVPKATSEHAKQESSTITVSNFKICYIVVTCSFQYGSY